MRIEDIHYEIGKLFQEQKYPALTVLLPMPEFDKWATATSKRLHLHCEGFSLAVREFFWSLSHVQLALGYTLIARGSCPHPEGIRGEAFRYSDVPRGVGLAEMHFWYHVYCARECIYRSWERITRILQAACYPDSTEKIYFDDLVSKVGKDSRFAANPQLSGLKREAKHWNKVAHIRNELSHLASSPFKTTKITGAWADIVGSVGQPLLKLRYSFPNIKDELNCLKNHYLQLSGSFKAAKEFIDNVTL